MAQLNGRRWCRSDRRTGPALLRQQLRRKLFQRLPSLIRGHAVKTAWHEHTQCVGQTQGLGTDTGHPELAPGRENPHAKAECTEWRHMTIFVGDNELLAPGLECSQIRIGEGFLLHDSRKVKSNAPAGMPVCKPAARTIHVCAVSAPHGSTAAGGLAPGRVRVGRFRSQLRGLS